VGGVELLYGRHAVLEALRAGRRQVHRIYLGEGVRRSGIVTEIVAAAGLCNCPVMEASQQTLGRVGPANHQGVIAEAAPYPYADLDEATGLSHEDPLFLVLDHLQDVQNIGTLLRTAEAMAVRAVLLPERRSAAITPAVVNASAGAVEYLRVVLVGNLVQAVERLRTAGIWIAGLDMGSGSIPLNQANLNGPLAVVVGAEGTGLSRLVRDHCDWLLTIPMYGRVSSLNAAVAGSAALIAARQARSGS
jgi:23S rRNA (guanosine2251-2'-O)-methyltransferase